MCGGGVDNSSFLNKTAEILAHGYRQVLLGSLKKLPDFTSGRNVVSDTVFVNPCVGIRKKCMSGVRAVFVRLFF